MSKFRVTYPSGVIEETEQSDCDTLEQFINTKFGSADYASNGVIVEHIQGCNDFVVSNGVFPEASKAEVVIDDAVAQAGYPEVTDEDVLEVQDAACDASWLAVVEAAKAEGMADQSVVDALVASVEEGSDIPAMSAVLDMQPFIEDSLNPRSPLVGESQHEKFSGPEFGAMTKFILKDGKKKK